jgi:hypothetical protein
VARECLPRNEALRAELLALAEHPGDPVGAERLWSILDDYEAWPGRALVGDDGEHAAWLVVQLADTDLQRRALEHLEAAVDCGDADPCHFACLLDRVRMAEGRPQVFGSQFVSAGDGAVAPWPIEDPCGVDERRRSVGLEPLALQARRMQAELHAHS